MALDDFMEDDEDQPHPDKEELQKESPDGDFDGWIEAEPGTPDWLGFICWDNCEVSEEEARDDNLLKESGEAIKIQISGVESTSIICTNPRDLSRYL